MTSRVRRIVLAMYGHTKPVPASPPARTVAEIRAWLATQPHYCATHGCYEAMDDVDEAIYFAISDAFSSPIIGGNFGLPCA